MQEYTLVVVDMQEDFSAANNPATIAAVEQEILEAVRLRFGIVVLQIPYWSPMDWPGNKPTHRSLMAHLTGYDRVQVREKLTSDGSRQVLDVCREKGFSTARFREVGVNTDACIIETAFGIVDKEPSAVVEVVKPACNTSSPTVDWDRFLVNPNVHIVGLCSTQVQAAS